jgi:D-cysteine desulfhydrase
MQKIGSLLGARYPTPVSESKRIRTQRGELWIKNDGLTRAIYGGNKVRKLERILRRVCERGVKRLVTAGAAGSHHVLATTLFAERLGLEVRAYLWPQPYDGHAEQTVRAAIAHGLHPICVRSAACAAASLFTKREPGEHAIPIGGVGLEATLAYVEAIAELRRQIESDKLPEPDSIVVAVGTGSTAAGLLAGCAVHGMKTRIVGVLSVHNPVARSWVVGLAARALRELRRAMHPLALRHHLEIDPRQVGPGYGHPTAAATHAQEVGRMAGLHLDPTYTAKAFVRALRDTGYPGFGPNFDKVRLARPRRTLYWHTLSETPLDDLLANAPPLPERVRQLFIPARTHV